jgi:hypothetical protein
MRAVSLCKVGGHSGIYLCVGLADIVVFVFIYASSPRVPIALLFALLPSAIYVSLG